MKIINKLLCGIALAAILFSCKSTENAAEAAETAAETVVETAETVDDSAQAAANSAETVNDYAKNVAENSEEISAQAEQLGNSAASTAQGILGVLLGASWHYAGENQTLKFKLNGTCEYWENDSVAKCNYEIDKNVIKITKATSLEKEGSEGWKGSFDAEEYLYFKDNKLYAFTFKKDGDVYKSTRLLWYSDKKTGELIALARKGLVYTLEADNKLNVKYDMEFAYNNSKAQEKHSVSGGTWKKSKGVLDLGGWGKYNEYGDYIVRDSDYFFVMQSLEERAEEVKNTVERDYAK